MLLNLLAAVCITYWSALGTLLINTQALEPDYANFANSGPDTLLLPIPMMVTISMYSFALFHQIIITQQN